MVWVALCKMINVNKIVTFSVRLKDHYMMVENTKLKRVQRGNKISTYSRGVTSILAEKKFHLNQEIGIGRKSKPFLFEGFRWLVADPNLD